VLPDLYPLEAEPAALPRLPSLERLLARADLVPGPPDWREFALGAFGLPPGTPAPVGSTIASAAGLALADATWLLATPVELAAGLTQLRLVAERPAFSDAAARTRFIAEHARDFAGAPFALVAADEALLLRAPAGFRVSTEDPARVLGREVGESLPAGPDGPLLRRHMTELSMWMHARGQLSSRANALWCWGASAAPPPRPPARPRIESQDLFVRALERLAPPHGSPVTLITWALASLPADGAPLETAEASWFAPLERSLAAGRAGRTALWFGGRSYVLARRQRFRLLRRARPWWEP
jgi:hypothetical protein